MLLFRTQLYALPLPLTLRPLQLEVCSHLDLHSSILATLDVLMSLPTYSNAVKSFHCFVNVKGVGVVEDEAIVEKVKSGEAWFFEASVPCLR
jgi:hypothetical protein